MSESLKEKWEKIQKKTFTNWVNSHLVKKGVKIEELTEDLKNGVNLIYLLEAISEESMGKFNKTPKMRIQFVENCGKALTFIKDHGVKLAGTGAEEIVDGNVKMTLGLIWTLILRFAIAGLSEEGLSAKEGLLLWCQRKTEPYDNVDIKDFTMSWQDGLGLCALIHRHRPDLIPQYHDLSADNKKDNLNLAFDVAFEHLDVAKLLDAEDIVDLPRPDERSMMTYIAQLYAVFAGMEKYERAGRRVAKFLDFDKEMSLMVAEYERRTTELNNNTSNKSAEFSQASLSATHADAKADVAAFKEYKRTEHRGYIAEQGDLASMYSNIQSKLRAASRPPYDAPEGLLPSDAEAGLETLFEAERARLTAINANLREIRNTLRKNFADLANPFYEQIVQLKHDLGTAFEGELEDHLVELNAKLANAESLNEQIPALQAAEQELVDANIEDNEYTDHDVDDLEFQLGLVKKAYTKKVDFVNSEIMAKSQGGISAEQIAEFQETFRHFDSNESGSLSKLEFKSGLAGLGLIEVSFEGESDKKVDELWKKLALDGENIMFEQFIEYMVSISEDRDGPEQLKESFQQLANGKDYVTEADLRVGGMNDEQIQFLLTKMPPAEVDGGYNYELYIASIFRSEE